MKMRCVSVVERLEIDASVGSVMPAAICVEDVDNDGTNELIVGTIDGCVYIYKSIDNTKPWCQWSCATANEGSSEVVSCLTVGDVFNKGKKFLIVLTTAGWIHVFDVHCDVSWPRLSKSRSNSFSTALRPSRSSSNTMVSGGTGSGAAAATTVPNKNNETLKDSSLRDIGCDASTMTTQNATFDIKPTFSQRFAFNFNAKIVTAAQVCLSDACHQDATLTNSKTRLVVAYTDRIVRLFTWHDSIFTTSATLNGGLTSPFEEVHFNLLNSEVPATGAGGGPGSTATTTDAASNTASAQGSGSGDRVSASRHSSFSTQSSSDVGPVCRGAFRVNFMWTLAGQVDSLSVLPCARENCSDEDENCGCTQVLASQPGGKFVSLSALEESSFSTRVESEGVKEANKKGETGVTEEKSDVPTTGTTMTCGGAGEDALMDSISTRDTATSDLMRERSSLEMNYPMHGIVNMRNISSKSDRMRPDGISTRVLCVPTSPSGDASSSSTSSSMYTAITTLDGGISFYRSTTTFKPMDSSTDSETASGLDQMVWAKQLDHEIAFIDQLRPSFLNGVNHEPLNDPLFVVSAWDGQTFVFNKEGDILKFFIEDSISAFAVGRLTFDCPLSSSTPHSPNIPRCGSNSQAVDQDSYSNSPKATNSPRASCASSNFPSPRPSNSSANLAMTSLSGTSTNAPFQTDKLCFVYVTTNGRILVVPVIEEVLQEELKSTNLLDTLEKTTEGDSILNLIDQLGLSAENAFEPKLKDFIHYVLYS